MHPSYRSFTIADVRSVHYVESRDQLEIKVAKVNARLAAIAVDGRFVSQILSIGSDAAAEWSSGERSSKSSRATPHSSPYTPNDFES